MKDSEEELLSQASIQDLVANRRIFTTNKKRKSNGRLQQLIEEESNAEITPTMLDNENNLLSVEFVENDEDGEEMHSNNQVVKPKKKRAKRITEIPKSGSLFVVDAYGEELPSNDGFVKINLAKFILTKLSEEQLADFNKRGQNLTADHYHCLLFTNVANTRNHPRFIKVGSNTGNLMRHCKAFHQNALDGITELISKSPKQSVVDVVKQYILKQRIPSGKLDVLFARKQNTNVRLECALFIWML